MEMKKKRGNNYTQAEKKILLELIRKHKNVIDSKETNAHMIFKKRQSWASICQQYNAVAASGPRTWQQLRHLYENMKQRFKKKIAENHKEVERAGSGTYKKILNKQGAQILVKVSPQLSPLEDPSDDEAAYFCDTEIKNNSDSEVEAVQIIPEDMDKTDNQQPTGPITKNIEENSMKREYFRTKLRNAKLENKYLINKHKMEVKKYRMEMEILKLRLQILESSSRKQKKI